MPAVVLLDGLAGVDFELTVIGQADCAAFEGAARRARQVVPLLGKCAAMARAAELLPGVVPLGGAAEVGACGTEGVELGAAGAGRTHDPDAVARLVPGLDLALSVFGRPTDLKGAAGLADNVGREKPDDCGRPQPGDPAKPRQRQAQGGTEQRSERGTAMHNASDRTFVRARSNGGPTIQ